MSNTLHNVVNTSFFPTVNELSSGVKWFKDHPILTAVAATAVSAITYWGSVNYDSDREVDDSEKQELRVQPKSRHCVNEEGKSVEHTLSACVSWCDEHGSSLTQVFEDIALSNDSESEEDTQIMWKRTQFSTTTGSRSCEATSRDNTSDASALSDSIIEDEAINGVAHRSNGDFEIQSESPQWGWYVAITPPEDNSLAREVPFGMAKKVTSERTSPPPILKRTPSGKLG
uniref:Uncharacterized protein AlNc14C27G2625 n=1 Tax=Albugo laibachii Nc14 TaxID=890382 RepID=F0W6Z2_9STRA|nr:conserved hypothetical protein [Albugo laibachii Nc14]|eukprot:CCA16887.1 conserved hypothetical protein [Albugo laibachii Nc14]